MKQHKIKSEKDYIKKYRDKGFVCNYSYEEDKLINPENSKYYNPDDIYIVSQYRFEGVNDPSNTTLLYVIKTKDDSKGTMLVEQYAEKNQKEIINFLDSVPKENISNDEYFL